MKNKFRKAGILIALLVIPAFVFILLKSFGKNTFDLPYFFPKTTVGGEVMINEGDTLYYQFPAFDLMNSEGSLVQLSDFHGEIKVFSLLSPGNELIESKILNNLTRVHQSFKEEALVNIFTFHRPNGSDSMPYVGLNTANNKKERENWETLDLDDKWAIELLDFWGQQELFSDSVLVGQGYHSERLFLVDGMDYFRGIYSGSNVKEMDRLRLEIKVLLDGIIKNER